MELEKMVQDVGDGVGDFNTEDVHQLSRMKDDDGVFRATLNTLLRRQSVDHIDLDKAVPALGGHAGVKHHYNDCLTRQKGKKVVLLRKNSFHWVIIVQSICFFCI